MHDYESSEFNYAEGMDAYRNARAQAFWQEVLSLVRGKPAELLSFEDVRARLRLREEYYRGLQDIPLDRIVGSVGRYRDFTSNFLPKRAIGSNRWSRVYAQVTGLGGLPPIEVYKVDDVYFVRDGNHRVSVARQLGSRTIQAHVTELPTTVDLEPGMTMKDLDAVSDYANFLRETSLGQTRPYHQPINLSEPSRYSELMGHVNLHRDVMEQRLGQQVTIEEAAADWYDSVYRPAVSLIRKYDILGHTPGRTEGDMYLWMVEHLEEIREDQGEMARSRTLSDALVDYLAERHIPVPKALLIEPENLTAEEETFLNDDNLTD